MSRANEMSRGTAPFAPQLADGWCCYLLLCLDGSYYCGITSDLRQRIHDHASGKGGAYTKHTRPVALVWYSSERDRQAAAKRELQIKAWGNDKKRKLAAGEEGFVGMGNRVVVSLDRLGTSSPK